MDEFSSGASGTTDVNSGSPSAGAPSSGAAPAPGGLGDQGGPATGQPGSAAPPVAPQVESQSAAVPDFELPENDDDLRGQERNPHVQGILNLRGQYRTLLNEHRTLKTDNEAWQGLSPYGDPSAIQNRLGFFDNLNSLK